MSVSRPTGLKEQRFILVSIVLLIITHSFSHLFGGTGYGETMDGGALARKVLLVIYLSSLLLATRDLTNYVTVIKRTWLLWVLVALSIVSVSWASLPELTFRRSIALMLSTAYGVYIADKVEMEEMLYLLARVFAVIIVINLFVIFVFPLYGVHQSGHHLGAWRGFFAHKNTLGQMMLFAGLIYFTLAMHGDRFHRKYWIGFVVSGALVLKSHSQTSLLVLFITCGCTPFLKIIRWPGLLSKALCIFGFIFIAIFSCIVAINIEEITAIFGRDATFTGRDMIWKEGLTMIREQPWLGFGFGSEWIHDSWGFIPAWYANPDKVLGLHSGYLELLAQLGITGGVLYGVVFVYMSIRAVLLIKRSEGVVVYWPIYYLVFLSVYNFFERLILQQNSFIWIMFVMVLVWVSAPLQKKEHLI